MKSLEKELLEIENFYKHCTPIEAVAFFKAQTSRAYGEITKILGDIQVTIKQVKTGLEVALKRDKTRSCLAPMGCRTVTPARPYDMDAGKWMDYIRSERRYMDSMLRIQEEIAMEELLIQAQKILINK